MQISHFYPHHVVDNLKNGDWPLAVLVLFGYAVFLVLGWRETPRSLERMLLYLILVLLISNLFFG